MTFAFRDEDFGGVYNRAFYERAQARQEEIAREKEEKARRLEAERERRERIEREKADRRRKAAWAARLKAMEAARRRPALEAELARKTLKLDDIVRRARLAFGVTKTELRSADRTHAVVFARQFVYYWACRRTELSYVQIGRLLGGRDHTAVLHGKDAYVRKRAAMGRQLRRART